MSKSLVYPSQPIGHPVKLHFRGQNRNRNDNRQIHIFGSCIFRHLLDLFFSDVHHSHREMNGCEENGGGDKSRRNRGDIGTPRSPLPGKWCSKTFQMNMAELRIRPVGVDLVYIVQIDTARSCVRVYYITVNKVFGWLLLWHLDELHA